MNVPMRVKLFSVVEKKKEERTKSKNECANMLMCQFANDKYANGSKIVLCVA